jgi:hypothetical protein
MSSFSIITSAKKYKFTFKKPEERQQWMTELRTLKEKMTEELLNTGFH